MKMGLFVLALSISAAFASSITYTISTSAGGSIGSTNFNDNTITFTQTSDTSLVTNCSPGVYCTPTSTSNTVTIGGIGTYTVTDSTFFVVNHGGPDLGFADVSLGLNPLAEDDTAFGTYTLQTALGPIFDVENDDRATGINTTGGVLSFTGNSLDATFTAVVNSSVPEPGSLGLMLAGGIAILSLRRKHRV